MYAKSAAVLRSDGRPLELWIESSAVCACVPRIEIQNTILCCAFRNQCICTNLTAASGRSCKQPFELAINHADLSKVSFTALRSSLLLRTDVSRPPYTP